MVPPAPALASGFHERGRYHLELDHASACVLVLDDVELPCLREATLHRWEWQPGFYAGTLVAELFDDSRTLLCSYHLDVAPEGRKLGQTVYQEMVGALLAEDPRLLFGSEAAQHTIGVEGELSNVHLSYARLKRFGPQLLQAVTQVCARPLARLRSERSLQPVHRARRFDQQTLQSIARDPLALVALRGGERSAASIEQLLFNVAVSREELDTPAHRALLSILVSVIRRTRVVRDGLIALSEKERADEVRTAMQPRLAFRLRLLDDLEATLRRVCRSRPFSDVSRREVSAAGLNVIAGHPLYARTFRSGWQILRPGWDGEHAGEMLPVSPTWEVYERWCFLQMCEALRRKFPELVWSRRYGGAGKLVDRIVFVGVAKGVVVRAQLQATFSARDPMTALGRFSSISAQRRPDIVVTYANAGVHRMLVFDAKYSVSRQSVLAAMGAAHIYHDSLRWQGRAPDRAMLLIPAGGGASWLEGAEFHAEHAVGAMLLSPSVGIAYLDALLKDVLNA